MAGYGTENKERQWPSASSPARGCLEGNGGPEPSSKARTVGHVIYNKRPNSLIAYHGTAM